MILVAILGLTVITVLLALYVTIIRPVLRKSAAGAAFLDKIEPIERVLWWKSETILWSRFKVVLGTILTMLLSIDPVTLAPFMSFIPEKYRFIVTTIPTIALALDGLMGEWLRRDTTKPLEVVAMRTDAPEEVKAQVAEATAMAKAAVAQVVQNDPSVAINRS